ncbi:MAG: exodeoxyribonuclease III [Proteobacteria bacterium]|nr:exodeoxyribonuclease III [Pseudomonadota bacterium]
MKIATWNVNSVRARLPHLQQWLAEAAPDVVLLQETKSKEENFPHHEISACGYHSAHYGQPSYNGVAILAKTAPTDVVCGNPHRPQDPQARIIAATVAGVRLLSVYVPNGQAVDSEKYNYKLEWLADFSTYLSSLPENTPVVAGGDYNIAPAAADIFDAEEWGEGILASVAERAALQQLFANGYADAHRLFTQEENVFSWWDYRAAAFRRNRGLRIDLILVNKLAAARSISCVPDVEPRRWERPSDHTPVVLTLSATAATAK